MNSFFVFYSRRNLFQIQEIINDILDSFKKWKPDSTEFHIGSRVGFVNNLVHTTPQSRFGSLPFIHEESKCTIVADARIDYRENLFRELNLIDQSIESIPDHELILLAYLKWKEDCVQHLFGDFAFVIWDEKNEKLFCARDHIGCKPLFYVESDSYIAISSDPVEFENIPGFKLKLREQSVVDSICSIPPDREVSVFEQIFRLEPAHYFIVNSDISINVKRYWDLNVCAEYDSLSEDMAIGLFRSKIIEAVKQRSRSSSVIGVELSGGLDSSCVLSCMKMIKSTKQINVFSHVLPNASKPIPEKIKEGFRKSRSLVKFLELKKHTLITGSDNIGFSDPIIDYVSILRKPVLNNFSLMSDLLLNAVNRSGINVLVSGFGGDEGISYSGTGYFDELVKRGKYNQLRRELKNRDDYSLWLYILTILKKTFKQTFPKLYQVGKKDWRRSRYLSFALNDEIHSNPVIRRRYFNKVFLPSYPDVKKRQYYWISHPNLLERLEDSYFIARSRRIEYRYPLLDVKLLEFHYSLKSTFKYRNGLGRYIFRMALKNIIPEDIRLSTDKSGPTIPYSMKRLFFDQDNIRGIIEEGEKYNRFHFVDYDKLYKILDLFLDDESREKNMIGTRELISPLSVLLLQKWHREGEIDMSMKC